MFSELDGVASSIAAVAAPLRFTSHRVVPHCVVNLQLILNVTQGFDARVIRRSRQPFACCVHIVFFFISVNDKVLIVVEKVLVVDGLGSEYGA